MARKRAQTREGMVVSSLALPPDLHRRLAIAGIEDGVAMTEIIRVAVREWLERRGRQRKRGKRS